MVNMFILFLMIVPACVLLLQTQRCITVQKQPTADHQIPGQVSFRFCTGFIYWDDEDHINTNTKSGSLPDGVYDRNTKIYYCCRSDGSSYSYINLPTSKPFYLYKYTSRCQRVRGMTVRQESVKIDDEDDRNGSSDGGCHPSKSDTTKVDYCYYY